MAGGRQKNRKLKGKLDGDGKEQNQRSHDQYNGEGKEGKRDLSNYVLNVDSHIQQLHAHLRPDRATHPNYRCYNPSTPTICTIWRDPDLHRFFPVQLSVMLDPAILSKSSEYHGLLVFPELVKPVPSVPPEVDGASSSALAAKTQAQVALTTAVEETPTVGSRHTPQWVYLPGKQQVMNEAVQLVADECSQMFVARQNTEDIRWKETEAQLLGLHEEPIPDPHPFVAVAEDVHKSFRKTTDTLEFNILYTDHTTTLTGGAATAEQTKMADFLQMEMTEINRFFGARGLPAFDANQYTYFFVPGVGKQTLLAEWAIQPNAAIVFLPTSRVNEGYHTKCLAIPELKRNVEALMVKVRFQVKMLKTLHQTLHPLWLAIAAQRHCSSWKELNANAPNALYKVLRDSMLAAEKASVQLEECLIQPLSRLQKAALERNRSSQQILEEARKQVAELRAQKTNSSCHLSRLQQQAVGDTPEPLSDKEMAHLKNEVAAHNNKYTLRARRMFKVWGCSFLPYVRRQIMADVTRASRGHIPFPDLDYFGFPRACGPDWNQTLEVIKSDAPVMRYLEKLGMTARLLDLTKTDGWDRKSLPKPVDQTPPKSVQLASGGYEVCHDVTDEEKAAAITSPTLLNYKVPLTKLLRFYRRHSGMPDDIDLEMLATYFNRKKEYHKPSTSTPLGRVHPRVSRHNLPVIRPEIKPAS